MIKIRFFTAWLALTMGLGFPLQAVAKEVLVEEDVEWASPEGQSLKVDIYTPGTGQIAYPVVVIYHGGGWLINDHSIMDAAARYLAEQGEFVVANMDYRLLPHNGNRTRMNEIVEDVFGGLLWVKDHIGEYRGDPERIAVTGDSAGGHLSAMILTAGRNLKSGGFSAEMPGFNPTYLPEGKTAEDVAEEDGLAVQAAVLSYGAFDLQAAAQSGLETSENVFWRMAGAEPRGLFGEQVTVKSDPVLYRAVSPLHLVPHAEDYPLPPVFAHVGSDDQTTPPEAVKAFVETLKRNEQPVTLKVYEGKRHAYLDTGCNEYLGSCFDTHATEALDDMIRFLDRHLR